MELNGITERNQKKGKDNRAFESEVSSTFEHSLVLPKLCFEGKTNINSYYSGSIQA